MKKFSQVVEEDKTIHPIKRVALVAGIEHLERQLAKADALAEAVERLRAARDGKDTTALDVHEAFEGLCDALAAYREE